MAEPFVQPQAFLEDGTPIPPEQLGQAIASGAAFFEKGAKVSVVDAVGVNRLVDASEVAGALQGGEQVEGAGRVAERERGLQYGTIDQAALAGVEGAARGLTVGLSDVALAQLGPEYREGMQGRREVQGAASLGGEVVGALAPLLLSGGTSAAAQGVARAGALPRGIAAVGGAAERALGGGIAGRLAGGAAEGALYGAGLAVGDIAVHEELQDPQKAAEYLLGQIVQTAMFGGAAGALYGVPGALRRALPEGPLPLPRMKAGGLSRAASDVAEQRAVKAVTGNYKAPFEDLTARGAVEGGGGNRIGRKMLDAGIPIEEPAAAAKALGGRAEEALGRMRGALDEVRAPVDVDAVITRGDAQAAALRARNSTVADQAAAVVEEEIGRLRKAVHPPQPGDLGVVRRGAGGAPEPVTAPGRQYSVGDWWQARKDLDQRIKWAKREGLTETEVALRDLRNSFEEELTATIEKHGSTEARQAWESAKQDYADFSAAQRAAQKLDKARGKNRTFSLSDYLATGDLSAGPLVGMLTGSPLAAVGMLATQTLAGAANKFARERGSALIARLADRVAKSTAVDQAAARAMVDVAPKAAGPLPARALRDRRVASPIAALTGKRLKESYDEAARTVRENADPRTLTDRLALVTKDLDEAAPDMALAMAAQAQRVNAMLFARMPVGASRLGHSITPDAEEPVVRAEDMRKFLRMVATIRDPESVIEELGTGKVDLDQIDVLRTIAPKRWENLRLEVMRSAAERDEPLPYSKRVLLGVAFGFQSDASLDPAFVRAMNALSAPPPEASRNTSPRRPKMGPEAAEDMRPASDRLSMK